MELYFGLVLVLVVRLSRSVKPGTSQLLRPAICTQPRLVNTMPRSRSRSPAPRRSPQRRRSRSPDRQEKPRDRDREGERERTRDREPRDKPKKSGFKWKEKRRDEDRPEEPKRLERGYRNRSPSPRRHAPAGKGSSVEDKFGVAAKFGPSVADKFGSSSKTEKGTAADTSKPPQRAAAAAPVASGEPMIIVHINDRLGTKAAIPCLASDPVKLFKAQVAARIGRQPHEIMLKRQGERPFKDQLTLEDYGVSNGVQLDLEIDTGD